MLPGNLGWDGFGWWRTHPNVWCAPYPKGKGRKLSRHWGCACRWCWALLPWSSLLGFGIARNYSIRASELQIQGHHMSLSSPAASSLSPLLFAFPGNPIKFQYLAPSCSNHPCLCSLQLGDKSTQANPEKAIKERSVWINTLENLVFRDFSCCSSVCDNHNLNWFQMSFNLPFASRKGVIDNVDFLSFFIFSEHYTTSHNLIYLGNKAFQGLWSAWLKFLQRLTDFFGSKSVSSRAGICSPRSWVLRAVQL